MMTPTQQEKLKNRVGNKERERMERHTKKASDDKPLTEWMEPTPVNYEWIKNEVAIGNLPGHSKRKLIYENEKLLNGNIALARGN